MRRDHRKLLAVDGAYASTGGVCISEVWRVRSPKTGLVYRGTAVSVRGPAVADLGWAFAGSWDEMGLPLPKEERPGAESIPLVGDEAVRLAIQEPRKMRVLRLLGLVTAGVQRRLWITDAYFLSLPILTQALSSDKYWCSSRRYSRMPNNASGLAFGLLSSSEAPNRSGRVEAVFAL